MFLFTTAVGNCTWTKIICAFENCEWPPMPNISRSMSTIGFARERFSLGFNTCGFSCFIKWVPNANAVRNYNYHIFLHNQFSYGTTVLDFRSKDLCRIWLGQPLLTESTQVKIYVFLEYQWFRLIFRLTSNDCNFQFALRSQWQLTSRKADRLVFAG